jgi:hypothetical protein
VRTFLVTGKEKGSARKGGDTFMGIKGWTILLAEQLQAQSEDQFHGRDLPFAVPIIQMSLWKLFLLRVHWSMFGDCV